MWLAIDVIVKKLDSRNEADRCNVYFTGLGHAVTFLFACFFPCMLVMSSNTLHGEILRALCKVWVGVIGMCRCLLRRSQARLVL